MLRHKKGEKFTKTMYTQNDRKKVHSILGAKRTFWQLKNEKRVENSRSDNTIAWQCFAQLIGPYWLDHNQELTQIKIKKFFFTVLPVSY